MDWYLTVLRKYAVFQGRARRKEYWMFALINTLLIIGVIILDGVLETPKVAEFGILTAVYVLFVLIPNLAVSVRRLHDTGRTGWWLLIGVVPIVGPLVLLVFNVLDSAPGSNEYGPNLKTAHA